MDSWSVRGSVWAPACKRGCALREAACPVDRARRERHALLTGRDAKGTRRSRRRGVADHRRLVSRPRATHIPACMLAPSPASASGVSPLASIVFESTRPIFQRIRRIRRGFVLMKLFLYQLVQKKFHWYKTLPFVVCNQWHTIQILTHFGCEKCTVCFKLYTTKTKKHETNPQWYKTNPHHTNTVLKGTKLTHTTPIPS
jgi:hypothetical protein